METYVQAITSHSGTPAGLDQLLGILKSQDSFLNSHLAQLSNVLETLDPAAHSLGYLFTLDAFSKAQQAEQPFLEYAARFLSLFTPEQVKLAPEKFCGLCRKYKDALVAAQTPRIGISPLETAIRRFQPSREHLTPMHADILQLCLLAHCQAAASELLSDDIFDVDPHKTCCTPTDLQLYCYYGGTVCAGRKQYARALELYLLGLTAPTYVLNAITAATYKKYVLVSILHTGHVAPLPRFTPSKVRSLVDGECRAYSELGNAANNHQPDKLRRLAEQHQQIFAQDVNLGLVRQVVARVGQRAIQRLTSTYLTRSLGDIASAVGMQGGAAEAEEVLLRMIDAGDIRAAISARDGMVRFLEEDPQQYSSAAMVRRLDGSMRACMELAARVKGVDAAVSTDRAYLNKTTGKASRFDAGSSAMAGDFLQGGMAALSEEMYIK